MPPPVLDTLVSDRDRLAALRQTGLLDTEPEENFDRLTRLAARLLKAPIALVSLIDEDRQFFKSAYGLAEPWASRRQTPLTHSFCQHTLATPHPLLIEDARADALVCDNRAIGELGVVAYAGVPLQTAEGHVLGSFAVIDTAPRSWSEDEIEILTDLAASVMTEIELRETAVNALMMQNRAMKESEEKLLLLNATDEGIYGIDHKGRCTFVNPSAARMLGWRRDQMLGQNMHELIHHHHADGMPYLQADCPIYQTFRSRTTVRVDEEVFWRNDGSAFPVRYTSSPIIEGGAMLGSVITFTDITEQRRTARRLHMQYAVSSILASGLPFAEAAPRLMEVIGEALGWQTGAFWSLDAAKEHLYCAGTWQQPGLALTAFDEITATSTFVKDQGLPGEVWAKGRAIWRNGVDTDDTFVRAQLAAEANLRGGIAFPIRSGDDVLGVIDFYTEHMEAPDQNLLDTLATLGHQIGQFIERTVALQAMQESEVRKLTMMETSLDAIVTIDHQGHVLEWSPAAEKTFGYTRGEAVGQEMATLIVPPGLRDAHRAGMARYLRDGKSKIIGRRLELSAVTADGTLFPVDLTITRLPFGDPPVFMGTLRDITDRKAHEAALLQERETFQQLAEAIPQQVWTANPDGLLTYVNQRTLTYFERTREQLIADNWQSVVHPDDLPLVVERWMTSLKSGETYQVEFRLRRADGTYLWHLGRAIPLRDANGTILRWFGTNTDISEHKRIQADLSEAKETAEVANRAKSQFLANMSHELRTPLNAVIGYSEMLQEEATEAGVEHFMPDLTKIHTAGKLLLSLVNDVLDLSKIEAGKMELYPETFDLGSVIHEVAATIEPLVQKNSNALALDLPEELGTMWSDQTKVRQVLFNLLGNAAKFTRDGTVTFRVARPDDDQVVFEISDTGIGMTPNQVKLIFQDFAQAHAEANNEIEGTGLGLAITRHLCRMLGGTIAVESTAGQGSTFTIMLPACMEPPEAPPSDAADAGLHAPPSDAPLVLVIDDDETARDLLRRFLTKDGFNVMTAASGPEGLRLARRHRPVAITTDVLMPTMDGWQVLADLKSDPDLADIPVIMLTGVHNQRMAYALGATDFMTKPIDRERLGAVLRRICANQEGRSVLVIEDEKDTRDLLRRSLVYHGYTVHEAANGAEGLERLPETAPNLIVLDLLMPEMDGFSFLEALRKEPIWHGIPVVVITAKDLTAEERRRLSGSVERVLQKGAYDREDLLREISARVTECITPPAR